MSSVNNNNQDQRVKFIECKDFQIAKFKVNKLSDKEKTKYESKQTIMFPKYIYPDSQSQEGSHLYIRTGPIQLVQFGIPVINEVTKEFYKTEKSKMKIVIPWDTNSQACNELFHVLEAIDKYMEGEKGYKSLLTTKNMDYISLVKEAREEDKENKKPARMACCNAKLSLHYTKNDDDVQLKTTFWVIDPDTKKPKDACVKNHDDAIKLLPWKSTAKFLLKLSKFWAAKQNKGKCGISIVCEQVEVVNTYKKENDQVDTSKYVFDSVSKSDSELDTSSPNGDKDEEHLKDKKDIKQKGRFKIDEDDEEDDEEEDKIPKKKSPNKPISRARN